MRPLLQCSSLALLRLLPLVDLLIALTLSPTPHVTIQRRLALIRLFSFLAVAVTVIVISSGLLRTIIHFMLKVWT